MIPQSRFIQSILILTLLGLVGCSGGVGGLVEISPVDDTTLVREIQYLDDQREGPMYNITLDIPEEWVGQFETATQDNRITFDFIVEDDRNNDGEPDGTRATIFSIEALSIDQYWNQIGSYPGDYHNLLFTADTYFIYYLPQFAYYSGLSDEDFEVFKELVPSVAQSLSAERIE